MNLKEAIRRRNYSGLGGGAIKRRDYTEDELQECFAEWLDEIGVLYNASCAGVYSSKKAMGMRKKMGYKKGFLDVFIYEPNRRYHGLAIDLKSKKGKGTKEQKEWEKELNYRMYHAVIMPSGLDFAQAMDWLKTLVKNYMNMRRR